MLRCVNGFYYSHDSNGASCHPCSKTCPLSRPFLGKECSDTMDRICCKENEMVVRIGKCEKESMRDRPTGSRASHVNQGLRMQKRSTETSSVKKKEEANSQENHGHRFSAGSISLMVPLALIVMRFS
ncbi:hypothetical protein PoB_007586100 [Plakobranchus ocellatus]|uniref:TNFR-Cys domain-containing protein n=1 Tax=Plakobranchus ocellatus TaxID=259542 RepID=A0AAV4DZ49_9GAST|nr:hypothetical protein PoB_007586100 [Plakobranchus ocellatus]